MITFLFALLLSHAQADDKSDAAFKKAQQENDLTLVCEVNKLALKLSKTKNFKNNAADLTERLAAMLDASLRSVDVKNAFKGLSAADPTQKHQLWLEVAKDLKIKWDCSEAGKYF